MIGRRRKIDQLEMTEVFETVIAAAKKGDPDSQTLLYENHVAMVYGYFRACGVVEIDDLTSEVFLGMLRNLHGFQGDQPEFRRWLMTIAHRRLVDNRRRQSANKTDLTDVAEFEEMSGETNVVELRALTVDPRLALAFSSLTDAQREVLALRFVADVSLVGVAQITNRPVGAIKSLQNRGLTKLRRNLRDIDLRREA